MMTVEELQRLSLERSLQNPSLAGTPPETPNNLAATARNLGILVQWSNVPGVDGYNLIINSTQDFSQPDFQVRIEGETSREYFYTLGNIGVTRYIAVQSYKGARFSALSSSVSATTIAATSGIHGPGDTNFNNTETTLATVTLTTTGNTLFVSGKCACRQNGAEKNVAFRLKEDGVEIDSMQMAARNSATNGNVAVAQSFSTPAAGNHTYIMTAQNTSDVATCVAAGIRLIAAEIPLLTSAGAQPSAPSISPESKEPKTLPVGSEYSGGFGIWR